MIAKDVGGRRVVKVIFVQGRGNFGLKIVLI